MNFQVHNLTFSYDRSPVLSDISFEIPSADFLGILGPNGCGKSTLLKLLARLLAPERGAIKLGGKSLAHYGRRTLARTIAYVPQETNWMFPFTVAEVVLMGRTPYAGRLGFETKEDVRKAWSAMERARVAHLAQKPVLEISGGERQRVLIARALAQEPRVLLLDEPNAHLDPAHQLEMFNVLVEEHRHAQVSVVCVSHDLNLAAMFCQRLLLMAPLPGLANAVAAIGLVPDVLTEENIRRVFQTPVVVDRHPHHSRLRITLDPPLHAS